MSITYFLGIFFNKNIYKDLITFETLDLVALARADPGSQFGQFDGETIYLPWTNSTNMQ